MEISCISGRLIDCPVCHRSIVNIAKLQSFVEGPWKTHQALLLTLPRPPRSLLTRSLTTSPMKFPDFDRNAGFSSWPESDRSLPGHLDLDPALPRSWLWITNVGLARLRISCCRNVEPKQLTVESFWEEDVASHPQLLRAVRRELLEQEFPFGGTDSVRDVGLDANAGNKRSVKIPNKREQKCRRRNAHIKVIQKGLKTKHQAMKLFKTGILPAASHGHAAMEMCPSSIQHKRVIADSCWKGSRLPEWETLRGHLFRL